ncbi:Conserved_hypothetical protein [Hexamita inflata]|uniref:Uncharacterized protein n=1 Tax=Hexamita inflata TaxID=28002 RepID=A0AA86NSB8_9EUKA|nr:Conserved hypothetical protein [Hexamita inflata]
MKPLNENIFEEMIQVFKDQDQNIVVIKNSELLNILSFINQLDIQVLQLIKCKLLHLQPDLNNESIVELIINGCDLKTIEGLQLPYLTFLNLSDNKLTSIKNIKNFTDLKNLNLSQNPKVKSHHLQFLLKLKGLDLSECMLSNIYALQSLVNLEVLNISGNRSINISKLENITSLKTLRANSCHIKDISKLKSLINLEVLSLAYNYITNIQAIQYLVKLTTLNLDDNHTRNISPLQYLHNLQELIIMDRSRTEVNVTPLKSLVLLKKLTIRSYCVQDIHNLNTLNNLEEFQIEYNYNLNISVIQFWANLKKLRIVSIGVKNLTVFRHLNKLEELVCIYNDNIDITPLQYLVNLKILNLTQCKLISITQLQPLINLQELLLASNQICDISSLEPLTKLQKLCLTYNHITDFSPIKQHPNYQLYNINCQLQPAIEKQILYIRIRKVESINRKHINLNRKMKKLNLNFSLVVQGTKQLIKQQQYDLIAFTSKIVQLFECLNYYE